MPVRDDSIIGKKFGRLTVIERVYKNNRAWRIKCICDCDGKEYLTHLYPLKKGITKSCGCWQKEMVSKANTKDISGKKFGRLTAIKRGKKVITKGGYQYYNYECECECGRKVSVRPSHLISGHTMSCGECGGLIMNGRLTSKAALTLHKRIGSGEHNYNIIDKDTNKKINVDIALVDEKIAIEYDCLHWHKDEEKDSKKTQLLIKNGWKVLRIRTFLLIPTKKDIKSLIDTLRETNEMVIIYNTNDRYVDFSNTKLKLTM